MNEPDEGAQFIPSPERIARMSRQIKAKNLMEKRLVRTDVSYVKSLSMRMTRVTETFRACGKQEVD